MYQYAVEFFSGDRIMWKES